MKKQNLDEALKCVREREEKSEAIRREILEEDLRLLAEIQQMQRV